MWKVVPLCEKQLRDVDKNDILHGGYFRKCNIYKSGGGYDKFPSICKSRLNMNGNNQFVVQLYACSLKCPYCYVTPDGIWGKYKTFTTNELIDYFIESKQDVFHLMGGSPALYLENWHEIIDILPSDKVFHSDLLCIEKVYNKEYLRKINKPNCLYAVSVKGTNLEEFKKNTGMDYNPILFWYNIQQLILEGINFYFTFTNIDKVNIDKFKKTFSLFYDPILFQDSFNIDLIDYEALKD